MPGKTLSRMEENDTLAESLHNGNEDALKAIYEIYGGSIYTLAEKELNGNTDVAKQVTADVFVALWEARFNIKTIQQIKSFLYVAAHNQCRRKRID